MTLQECFDYKHTHPVIKGYWALLSSLVAVSHRNRLIQHVNTVVISLPAKDLNGQWIALINYAHKQRPHGKEFATWVLLIAEPNEITGIIIANWVESGCRLARVCTQRCLNHLFGSQTHTPAHHMHTHTHMAKALVQWVYTAPSLKLLTRYQTVLGLLQKQHATVTSSCHTRTSTCRNELQLSIQVPHVQPHTVYTVSNWASSCDWIWSFLGPYTVL